jgi:hypothetical protein
LLEKFLGSHSHFWKSHPTQIAHFQHLCHSKQRGTKIKHTGAGVSEIIEHVENFFVAAKQQERAREQAAATAANKAARIAAQQEAVRQQREESYWRQKAEALRRAKLKQILLKCFAALCVFLLIAVGVIVVWTKHKTAVAERNARAQEEEEAIVREEALAKRKREDAAVARALAADEAKRKKEEAQKAKALEEMKRKEREAEEEKARAETEKKHAKEVIEETKARTEARARATLLPIAVLPPAPTATHPTATLALASASPSCAKDGSVASLPPQKNDAPSQLANQARQTRRMRDLFAVCEYKQARALAVFCASFVVKNC